MSIGSYIKEHPYAVGGGVIGAIALFLILRGGSGAASGDGMSSSDLASIYQVQAAAQTETQKINAGYAALQENNAAQLAGLQIQSQTALTLGLAQINAQQETTDLANTLTANVAMKQLQTQTDLASIAANAQIQQTSALTNVLVQQIVGATSTTIASINAQRDISMAAIENQCHGFGCLF